jgi:hypothetical protein
MIGYGFFSFVACVFSFFSRSLSRNEANDLYEKNLNENHWGYNLNIILINATEYSTDIVTY